VNITGYLQIDGPIILNNDTASKKGGQLWDIISDRSTKKDINDIQESHKLKLVEAIKNMNIKTFKYIDDKDEKQRVGVIANELPESFNNQLPTGIKTVKMDEILFSMIVAYQSLNKEVEALREQLNNK
jgi:hypothetical protein